MPSPLPGFASSRNGLERIAEPDFNKLESGYQLAVEIEIYRIREKYEAATESLRRMNRNFPSFGDYDLYSTSPDYDKVKKEYPPFQAALNNIKRAPLVNVEDYIKF